jgi:hypothetical protein
MAVPQPGPGSVKRPARAGTGCARKPIHKMCRPPEYDPSATFATPNPLQMLRRRGRIRANFGMDVGSRFIGVGPRWQWIWRILRIRIAGGSLGSGSLVVFLIRALLLSLGAPPHPRLPTADP